MDVQLVLRHNNFSSRSGRCGEESAESRALLELMLTFGRHTGYMIRLMITGEIILARRITSVEKKQ